MRKLYITLLCGLLCVGGISAGPRFASKKTASATSHIKKKAPSSGLWRPARQIEYVYDEDEWINLGEVRFQYDSRGNAIETYVEDNGMYGKTVRTFNDNNMPVTVMSSTSDDGTVWTDEEKTEYVYDPVIKDYFTSRMAYSYENGNWTMNYRSETNIITRDAAGNITEIVKSLPLGTDMIPGYKLMWNYDETNAKANGMTYYINYGGASQQWTVYDDTDYRNITWLKTNGQMTEADINDYLEGENLISNADVYYEDVLDGHYIVSYDDKGGYTVKETYPDPEKVGLLTVKTVLDEDGSYVIEMTEYFDEDGNYSKEPQYRASLTVTINSFGDIVLEEYAEIYDDGVDIMEGYAYDYTYDDNGNVEEWMAKAYDYMTMEYVPESKIEYFDYTNLSGLESVSTVNDAPVEYFDLQGRRVAGPTNGVYIRRQGAVVKKIVL